MCGFGGNLKAAVLYNTIQLQFIMSNETEEVQTPQQHCPFDDRILDDDYLESGKKLPVYTKLYVHISTETLVDSRPLPSYHIQILSTKPASPS